MGKNKNFHKASRLNPAVQKLNIEARIKKAMDESRYSGIEFASICCSLIITMVLHDKSNLPEDEIQRLLKCYFEAADSINKDYITIPDIITTLKEEYGFSMSEDKLLEYYPQLEGYLTNEEDKK